MLASPTIILLSIGSSTESGHGQHVIPEWVCWRLITACGSFADGFKKERWLEGNWSCRPQQPFKQRDELLVAITETTSAKTITR